MVTNPSLTEATDRRRNDPVVTDPVIRAGNGDRQAWDALVDRYAPLIWSICRRHRLGDADAGDVGQSVWLKLAGQLGSLRDPAALPGWLTTTTRRECSRIVRTARGPRDAGHAWDAGTIPDYQALAAQQPRDGTLTARSGAASLQIGGGELAEPVPAETGVMARVHHGHGQGHQALHGHAVLVDAGVTQLVQQRPVVDPRPR